MVFDEVSFLFAKYVEEWLNRNTVHFIGAIVAQLTDVYPSGWIDLSRMNPYSRLQLKLLSTIFTMYLCLL